MRSFRLQRSLQQRGSVIIVALWTITLMTILVTVIASQNRLSAQVAHFHQQELATWTSEQAAINRAEMDLMLEQMPLPAESEEFDSFSESMNAIGRIPRYQRHRGDSLELYYPQDPNIIVRIYDHAGKINMRQMSRARLRMMIEKKLGGPQEADQQQIDQLMDAWNDWLDLNDGPSPNGAEKDYYLSLPVPYAPRNGPIESVEEILSIRGFAEVFSDVNLEAAFTIYGEDELINLNVATIEAMRLIPGLDDELIADILEYREEKDFQGNGDVAQLIPAENMTDVRQWLNSRKETRYYTIMVYPRPTTTGDHEDTANKENDKENNDVATEDRTTINDPLLAAYAETVYVPGFTERPQIMKINPYQKLPLTALPAEAEFAE